MREQDGLCRGGVWVVSKGGMGVWGVGYERVKEKSSHFLMKFNQT